MNRLYINKVVCLHRSHKVTSLLATAMVLCLCHWCFGSIQSPVCTYFVLGLSFCYCCTGAHCVILHYVSECLASDVFLLSIYMTSVTGQRCIAMSNHVTPGDCHVVVDRGQHEKFNACRLVTCHD